MQSPAGNWVCVIDNVLTAGGEYEVKAAWADGIKKRAAKKA